MVKKFNHFSTYKYTSKAWIERLLNYLGILYQKKRLIFSKTTEITTFSTVNFFANKNKKKESRCKRINSQKLHILVV
jgi:hypothetical protein